MKLKNLTFYLHYDNKKQCIFFQPWRLTMLHTVFICMQNVPLTNPRPKSRIRKLSDMTPAADTNSVADRSVLHFPAQEKKQYYVKTLFYFNIVTLLMDIHWFRWSANVPTCTWIDFVTENCDEICFITRAWISLERKDTGEMEVVSLTNCDEISL